MELFKNDFSSSAVSSCPTGIVSTRKRTIRIMDLCTTVYGNIQRSFPDSSVPPTHPYSSPTAFRNPSDAYIDSPGCQSILIGPAFTPPSFLKLLTEVWLH